MLLMLAAATGLLARRVNAMSGDVRFLMDHAVTAEQEARPT